MKKVDIVREYLDKYIDSLKEGTLNKKQLARQIMLDYPKIFKNLEDVRCMIKECTVPRYKSTVVVNPEHVFISNQKHGIKSSLPKSEAKPLPDFIFPKELVKTFCFADVHIPYHDEKAVTGAVEYAKTQDIDSILINGDFLDMYQGSSFMKDPRMSSLEKELEAGYCFILYLKQELNVPIFYKFGNHEFRWQVNQMKLNQATVGIAEVELPNIIEAREWDVTIIQQEQKIKYGKLNIIHGHELKYGVYSPVNPAKGLFNKTKSNTLAGHWHQTSVHHESDFNEKGIGCFSLGCLCNLRPEYSPYAYLKWNHGFSILSKEADGTFHVDNRRIINGEVI